MRLTTTRHEFVERVPERLKVGVLYVSIPFGTAVHRCCCGCGLEVVTPLGPSDWSLTYDGESVTLDPSIGNWSFPCRSHYWIERGHVHWTRTWAQWEVDATRAADRTSRARHFAELGTPRTRSSSRGLGLRGGVSCGAGGDGVPIAGTELTTASSRHRDDRRHRLDDRHARERVLGSPHSCGG